MFGDDDSSSKRKRKKKKQSAAAPNIFGDVDGVGGEPDIFSGF